LKTNTNNVAQTNYHSSKLLKIAIIIFFCILLISSLCYFTLNLNLINFLPSQFNCPFKEKLNLPCPGCGMTRAFNSLSHGELIAAINYNPLCIVIIFSMALYVVLPAQKLSYFSNKFHLKWVLGIATLIYTLFLYL
jgi:hypothetical protein